MLSFRMILFCGVAGFCLWGLFNLLDNLKEPELLRSTKVIVVKGCGPEGTPETAGLCAQLRCQKALLDAKVVPLRTRFTVTIDRTDRQSNDRIDPQSNSKTHLVAGTTRAGESFACLLEQDKVTASRVITAKELADLDAMPGDWRL